MQDTKKTNTDKTTIGLLIKAKLRERKQSVVWLAGQLGCSRTNVYKIFGKKSIDTDELMKISRILNFDFFKRQAQKRIKKDFLNFQINKTDTRWALLLDAGAPIALFQIGHSV